VTTATSRVIDDADVISPGPDRDLRVALVQGDTRWHDPAGNRAYYGGLIAPLAGRTDLVVLPETFTSGFSNEALANAEDMQGPTVAWIIEQARALDAAVCGSVQLRIEGKQAESEGIAPGVYNRLLFATPDGGLVHYDKRHLFRMAKEHERYAAGERRVFVDWRGWRLFLQVCYDLRFPVYIRNRFDAMRPGAFDYDLALFVANWPAPRAYAWKTLLRARAIENLAGVIGVNRVGRDGNGLDYAGDSAALDPLGQPLVEGDAEVRVLEATFSAEQLRGHRERFPAQLDADDFQLGN
jgi:predicted amidohydrolase